MNKKYRKPLIAGNWKMNTLPGEVRPFLDELKTLLPRTRGCEAAICAPFTHLTILAKHAKDARLAAGAQDVSAHESGAYTGEVSAPMLKALDLKYVVVGHSERRAYHAESDAQINQKIRLSLAAELTPILCVGESLEQREAGVTMDFIAYQIAAGLAGLDEKSVKGCVVAYEPIWAIGTGLTATVEQAQEVCRFIRETLRGRFGAKTARSVRILYGGSMNAKNAAELLAVPDIDGGLIGGASLKPQDFSKIILATAEGVNETV
jgi:triosephosphate isomerase